MNSLAPVGGAAWGGGGATWHRGLVLGDSATVTETITVVKTEVAAAVTQLTRAEVDEVMAVQRAILATVQDLAAMAQQQQRQNPRWWASTAAVAVYRLIGILIAAATLLSDRLDALDDDQAIDPPPAATSPVVPGPAAPADDWTPDE